MQTVITTKRTCSRCENWSNKMSDNRLTAYKNCDANMGNGYCEIGICEMAGEYQYFDHECDCDIRAMAEQMKIL